MAQGLQILDQARDTDRQAAQEKQDQEEVTMHTLKKLALATATASIVSLSPMAALADDTDISRQLGEARQEGSIWTAIALNRHLSPFSIDVEVENGTATLTGEVENDVDRDLAGEVALGVEGIEEIDNQLRVDPEVSTPERQSDFARQVRDATLTATVKSRLLWNRNTGGLDIDVSTEDGVVSLRGTSESSEASDLAAQLARNTNGVRRVENDIEVVPGSGTADKARDAVSQAGDVVSDAWITSKVKSSFLFSRNLSGLDIGIETRDGKVTLSGSVESSAEKDLAVETAENIRGVTGVDAGNLRIAG